MSSPVNSLLPHSTLKEAQDIFLNQRYRYLPVVTEEDEVIGIISDRDLLNIVLSEESIELEGNPSKTVKDVMIRNVLIAEPKAELSAISEIFFKEKIGVMPITNAAGKLEGIITRSDILRTVTPILPTGSLNLKK